MGMHPRFKVDHSQRDSLCSLATSGQSYCRGTRQVELTGQADLTSRKAIADFNLPYQRRWDEPLLSEDEVDLKSCALQQTTNAPRENAWSTTRGEYVIEHPRARPPRRTRFRRQSIVTIACQSTKKRSASRDTANPTMQVAPYIFSGKFLRRFNM